VLSSLVTIILRWRLSSSNAHTDVRNAANDVQTAGNEVMNVRILT